MSTTVTLLTLPLLLLVSIPLVVTASITIFFSSIALLVQVSVVAFELCYALFTNLFTIPPSTSWSLLSFSVSGPSTPNRRHSSDYGVLHSPFTFRSPRQSQSRSRPGLGQRMGSSNPFLGSPETHNGNHNHNHSQDIPPHALEDRYPYNINSPSSPSHHRSNSFHSGFLGLVSGDSDRDFEGLGGWRCPPSYAKSPGYRSGGTTPSSSGSGGVSDEIDDLAWCSMNRRLELPSQPLMLRHSSSNHNLLLNDAAKMELYLPRRRNSRASLSLVGNGGVPGLGAPADVIQANSSRARHHRRSATTGTSLLSGSGASLTLSTSPTASQNGRGNGNGNDHGSTRHSPCNGHQSQTAIQSRGDALRSKSHSSLSDWGQHAASGLDSMAGSVSSAASAGASATGYFALQPLSASMSSSSEGGTGSGSGKVQRMSSFGGR